MKHYLYLDSDTRLEFKSFLNAHKAFVLNKESILVEDCGHYKKIHATWLLKPLIITSEMELYKFLSNC